MPALLDAGGARGARRPARQAAVRPVSSQAGWRGDWSSSARDSREKRPGASTNVRPSSSSSLSLLSSVQRQACRRVRCRTTTGPEHIFGRPCRRDGLGSTMARARRRFPEAQSRRRRRRGK
ncbi:hypothetical protein VPH35_112116 [Triticum aestivum]